MDNRRVFQSRQASLGKSQDGGDEGGYQSSSLRSKLKNIFARPWSSREEPSLSSSQQTLKNHSFEAPLLALTRPRVSQLQQSSQSQQSFTVPGSFNSSCPSPRRQYAQAEYQITKKPLKDEDDDMVNANEVLSSFFKKKGTAKLTEVEFEGVMSLMSKSRAGTPHKRSHVELSIIEPDQPAKRRHLNSELALLGNETSMVGSTPHKRQVLRSNANTSVNDLAYKSSYKSIYDDTFDRSYQNLHANNTISHMPRRVSSMSRRPAPYRSRMKAPISKLNDTTAANTSSAQPNGTLNESLAFKKSFATSDKPMSETAKALLTILDGKSTRKEGNMELNKDEKLKLFENPYSSNERSARKRTGKELESVGADLLKESKAHAKETEQLPPQVSDIFEDARKPENTENVKNEKKQKSAQVEAQVESAAASHPFSFLKNSNQASAQSEKPTFSFSPNPTSQTEKTTMPAFTFKPAPAVNEKPKSPTIAFSNNTPFSFQPQVSGGNTNKSPSVAADPKNSAVSNGNEPKETESKPFSFQFGAAKSSADQPASVRFNFGSNTNGSTSVVTTTETNGAQPKSFNFNFAPANAKADQSATPSFNFGSKTNGSSPAFSFATKTPNGSVESSEGGKEIEKSQTTTTRLAFSFAPTTTNTTTTTAAPFSFGAKPTISNGTNPDVAKSSEFTFPQPKITNVSYNQADVDKYKSDFPF